MSTFLGVGAVTAVIRGLIEASAARHGLAAVLGLAATPVVSALPPDRIQSGQGTPDRINLFLFQACENAAWRNVDWPSRNGHGDRVSSPKLALDLRYLVTAYGSADFHAEVLLGHAMYVLHETPVLTRQAIRDTLAAMAPSNLADALADAQLADQIEQLKIVPQVLNVEEVSKIWTALQSQYRTTAAYQVSVVLVESQQPARSALPVLTRGQGLPAGGDEGVFVHVGVEPPIPTLQSIALPAGAPAIRLGETLALRGHHLAGNQTRARFRAVRSTEVFEVAAAAGASASRFDVPLPPDPPVAPVPADSPLNPANWRSGIYEVSAVMEQGGTLRESNRLPLLLAPRLTSIGTNVVGGQLVSLQVTCSPPVRPNQSAALLVGDRALAADPIAAPTGNLSFPAPPPPAQLPSGPQWVRLRVDGMESLVVNYQAVPPQFEASQSVNIP